MKSCTGAFGWFDRIDTVTVVPRAGRAFEIVAVQDGVAVGATAAAAVDRTVVAVVVGVEVLGDVATVVDATNFGVPFSVTS